MLAFSAGLAACMREPDVIEPGEPLASDGEASEAGPDAREWIVPIPEGEEGCELRQIERMLNESCGACHGVDTFFPTSDGPYVPTPMSVSQLLALDKIVPGDADASRVMIRIYAGDMPPPATGLPPMPEADVAWLASFIDTLDPGVAPACSPAP